MEVTPTDELTGLPLPLVPLDDFGEEPNWHHHFHPKKHPSLLRGVAGHAVRQSRVQRYSFDLHTREYHSSFSGPPLPSTTKEKFITTVMAVAGYMPHHAIDMQAGGGPQIVELGYEQRRRLQTSGEIRIGADATIRKFIKEYVLSQGMGAIDTAELAVEEFIVTPNEERRRQLGHNLLGLVIDKATEPADEIYYQARKRKLLKPGLAGNVQRFIKAKLGPRRTRDNIVDSLYDRLATA